MKKIILALALLAAPAMGQTQSNSGGTYLTAGTTSLRLAQPNVNQALTFDGNYYATCDAQFRLWAAGSTWIPLTVKGYSGQTADLQRWTNSSDAVLAQVTATGIVHSQPNSDTGYVYAGQNNAGYCTATGYVCLTLSNGGAAIVANRSLEAPGVVAPFLYGANNYAVTWTTLTESTDTPLVTMNYQASWAASATSLVLVQANDATDFQAITYRVTVNSVRKATGNTVSTVASVADAAVAESAGGSTLSCTFSVTDGVSSVILKANCTSSLTQTTLRATVQAQGLGLDGTNYRFVQN